MGDRRLRWLLTTAAEHLPMVVWAMDREGAVTMSFGSGVGAFAPPGTSLVGRNVIDDFGSSTTIAANLERALRGESFQTAIDWNGRHLATWYQPVNWVPGPVEEVLALTVDLTDTLTAREADRAAEDHQRSLLLHVIGAQESERREIANDLHDDTVQVLSAVALQADLMRRQLANQGRPDLAEGMAELAAALAEAGSRLRGTMTALRPPHLGDGLATALRDLAESLVEPAGISAEVFDDSAEAAPELAARVLLRVTQEALNNVVRHSGARSVAIRLVDAEGGWAVTVTDDGAGPGPDGFLARPGHRGIAGMRERVEEAGGHVTLWGRPGSGTQVRAWVPGRSGSMMAPAAALDPREPLREILDGSAEGFMAYDLQWRIVFASRLAAELTGRPAAELEGRHVWTEFPESVGSLVYYEALRAMAEQRVVVMSQFLRDRWLEYRLVPTARGLFSYIRDVTGERAPAGLRGRTLDAGTLLLSAATAAAGVADPAERLAAFLDGLLVGTLVGGACVLGPDRTTLAGARCSARGEGSLIIEPLMPPAQGFLEMHSAASTHHAVQWLARAVAAMISPIVAELQGAYPPRDWEPSAG